jgi:hypothetical protein
MLWREDTDWAYAFTYADGTNAWAGDWVRGPEAWQWDGSNPDGVGMVPPPGLLEPVRGFGYVWRNFLGGPAGDLGWATFRERGFCASFQTLDAGLVWRSTTVPSCHPDWDNEAADPAFAPVLFGMFSDATWQRY